MVKPAIVSLLDFFRNWSSLPQLNLPLLNILVYTVILYLTSICLFVYLFIYHKSSIISIAFLCTVQSRLW